MVTKDSLTGTKVFVIEDEPLVAMFIEDSLSDIGCEVVASAASLSEAMALLAVTECDLVILDVNLTGEPTFAFAHLLIERRLPFIFSTGYGTAGIPLALCHVPVLQKPFRQSELNMVLAQALPRGKD